MLVTTFFGFAALVACVAEASALARWPHGPPRCTDVTTPVSVTATVRQFPANLNRTTFNYTTVPSLPGTTVSGDYEIAASYCEPGYFHPAHRNTLQILIHGLTYTRTYWSGLGHPPQSYAPKYNSYIDYASHQDYPTLSIDRLCNGNSTFPKNDNACQTENQVAVLKALVDKAKSGYYGGREFTDIVLVGHSFGSVLINAFTRAHPNEVHGIVLTGFSRIITQIAQALAAAGGFDGPSASEVYPDRFGELDPDYRVVVPETLFVSSFFAGSYNETVVQYNFNTTGTYNFLEPATIQLGQLRAKRYTGNVIVLNGELDAVVCNGNCGEGEDSLTQQVDLLYPNAKSFFAYNTANTGHCLNLHTSAPLSYRVIFGVLNHQCYSEVEEVVEEEQDNNGDTNWEESSARHELRDLNQIVMQ